ncbi:MAG: hypothetical protein IPG61_06140 [bacterium]|nr:hypothetical protein [bacterium]
MRSINKLVLCLALLAPIAAAAMGPVDLNAEVGYYGSYNWRGMTLVDGPVVQPELSAGLGGFGVSLWGNVDADDADGTSGFNEYDVTVSYGAGVPMASVDLGFIYYALPDASEQNTTEAFASASAGVLFSPTLTVYRDLDQVDGWYWQAGVSHGLPLSPAANVDVAARVGAGSDRYLQGYFPTAVSKALDDGTTASSLTDLSFTLSVPWHPTPLATVTPSVSWSTLMDDASTSVEDAGGDADALVWGVSAAVSF